MRNRKYAKDLVCKRLPYGWHLLEVENDDLEELYPRQKALGLRT